MSRGSGRLTDYETKEKLEKLQKKEEEYDPLEPQWDYDNTLAKLEKVGVAVGGTPDAHWPECWRLHLECAVTMVEVLQAAIKELNRQLDAVHNEALDY